MADVIKAFQEALLSSDSVSAENIIAEQLKGRPVLQVIDEIIVSSLDDIGTGWQNGEYALSQVYMSGRICEDLFDKFLPDESLQRKENPKIAIALLNDYHALGKRIVYSTLRAGGFKLLDYGRVEPEELVGRIREDRVELVLISVLMLSSALLVKDVTQSLSYLGSNLKIMVGGAPFRLDRQLWKEVGADAVGYSASDALHYVNSFLGGQQS